MEMTTLSWIFMGWFSKIKCYCVPYKGIKISANERQFDISNKIALFVPWTSIFWQNRHVLKFNLIEYYNLWLCLRPCVVFTWGPFEVALGPRLIPKALAGALHQLMDSPSSYAAFILRHAACCLNTGVPTLYKSRSN